MPMDAQTVFDNMLHKYVGCVSYQDSGIVHRDGKMNRFVFETFFLRPGRFRLKWSKQFMGATVPESIGALWMSEGNVSVQSGGKTTQEESISKALESAISVSGWTSHLVPLLLLASNDLYSLTRLSSLRLQEDETSHRCFHLIGSWTKRDDTGLWIDKDTFALMRTREGFCPKNPLKSLVWLALKTMIRPDGQVSPMLCTFLEPAKYRNDCVY